ncbi:biotin transporter BioY [Lacticaseibacillus daqingensis]|uniref:biotin transporter BioY n=1 Tax=Lacticaseibacillus daqingensis TaxID=2486014 RepID=UPI000F79378F|nr:biotin transporter BioY [Lacticaseibacillus daqingensis]
MTRTSILTRMALMLALLLLLAAMPPLTVGFLPVPIVLQNFAVMLVTLVLPVRPATATIGLLLGLAAVGLPVLSGGRGGAALFLGPTAGFMFGWLLTPLAVAGVRAGLARGPRWLSLSVAMGLGAVLLPNVLGALWLAVSTQVPLAASALGVLVYLPGDALKAALAVAVAMPVVRATHRQRA